ncbi:unnamed protein product [Psylliodes chrysocephalus]|uniref:DNA topoisomerase I n=1 Tax=Psylliodes chrysocephalus TaxID=3402493 RepID=A0A9P0CJK7_9CUCU|nr:unnamed protein product [Psylliodes chrysocephala]
MEVENSVTEEGTSPANKGENGDSSHVNGLNGYSEKHKSNKSEHKDKDRHRDKDRERDKDKNRSKDHKSSNRDKDKDRHHSSSKDKDRHSSSHKSSSKDKERSDKDKDRERSEKDRHRDKDKDRHRDDKKSSKDKDRDHKSSQDKDHKSSSRDKERDRDKDKEKRDKDRERDKDRDKHKNRDKDKEKEKDRHSGSKEKDKHRSKDRDKDRHHSSSKDKDKDRKDKERKTEKEKNSEEDSKVKPTPAEEPKVNKKEIIEINLKEEANLSTDDDDDKLVIKDEPSSQDEADEPIQADVSAASSCDYNLSHFKKNESVFSENEESESQTEIKVEVKEEEDSDEDMPLSARVSSNKRKLEDDDDEEDDDIPLAARKKPKIEKKIKKEKKKKRSFDDEEEEEDFKPEKKPKVKKEKDKKKIKKEVSQPESPVKGGRKKKEEEEVEVWKWWEEEKKDEGVKWKFLEHKGPVFAPPYEPLPKSVKFKYNGKVVELSPEAEEVAGFYGKMLDHDYTTKDVFNKNFFKDWRKVMNEEERELITDLQKCDFNQMNAYYKEVSEKNKNRSKEEKKELKEKNEALIKEYGFCIIDGHKEKIGNFRLEPPGLFRGRGEHPKMGKLKKRLNAEDIIINCSQDSNIPKPPSGHKWKEVRHSNTVTWLASWTENVQNQVKYIMLNPSSKLKGEKDWQKYENARRLHKCINKIRDDYQKDWKSKEMKIRQRAVAMYFIDKLALRAGNEKDEDQADTVGCCSLRVEHIELHEKKDDKEYVVVFDFLGKDSIRYYNEVPVEKRVFKNLTLFMENKKGGDDLFDRLNTMILNKHLSDLMPNLTAKVFRTYNASWTLQQQLDKLTNEDDSEAEKILSYNRANRAVAILCNHQRSVPKGHEKSMEKLKEKIDSKRDAIKDAERQVKDAVREAKHGSVKEKFVADKKKKLLQRLKEQLAKLEIQETDRDENKTIALGTSKLNYLDPRISVAWCKKYDVPIEKIYNKTQRDKFRWAIDMAGPEYRF